MTQRKEEEMPGNVVYLKCERTVEVTEPNVSLKNLGSLYCADPAITAKLKALSVHRFHAQDAKRCVISSLMLVSLMEQCCPHIRVQVIGEKDTLVEWVEPGKHSKVLQWLKVLLVCLICFFGTAFTIMAYHNDSGIHDIFTGIYQIFLNREAERLNLLEISYSIGLAAGIILFFNHVGGRRITRDPTPIEVALKNYEKDVDMTLIETADRKGEELDA